MELPNLIALAQRLRGGPGERSTTDTPRYPEILQELDRPYFQRFGEQFIKDTQVYRQTAPFFIDKFRLVGNSEERAQTIEEIDKEQTEHNDPGRLPMTKGIEPV